MPNKTSGSVLLVAFEREDKLQYPHLKAVLDLLGQEVACEYFYFRQRGHRLHDALRLSPRSILRLKPLRTLWIIAIDLLRLAARMRRFDTVVAVDNFTFICASIFHPKVILWSYDFITADQPHSSSWVQRAISQWTRRFLSRSRRIIIQDEGRKDLFQQTHGLEEPLDVYLLPVSLPACDTPPIGMIQGKTPFLMQIGRIHAWAGSDQLIKAYQQQANHYRLVLHGFLFQPTILDQLRSVECVPLCSMVEIPATFLHRLIQYADIGFINYPQDDQNNFQMGYASGQLCEFLRCSKPVISCGKTNLQMFVEEQGIGVAIESLDELPQAISRISNNYQEYSQRCYQLFRATYDLNLHQGKFASWVCGGTE